MRLAVRHMYQIRVQRTRRIPRKWKSRRNDHQAELDMVKTDPVGRRREVEELHRIGAHHIHRYLPVPPSHPPPPPPPFPPLPPTTHSPLVRPRSSPLRRKVLDVRGGGITSLGRSTNGPGYRNDAARPFHRMRAQTEEDPGDPGHRSASLPLVE